MKRLILMRHAKSDWSMDTPDHDRNLNKRGIRSAKALGRWLQDKGYLPDEVQCSTATRTRETLAGLGLDAATRFDRALYLASPDVLLEIARDGDADCQLLLAHNPGIAELAERIVSRTPRHRRFADYPTGATLIADFNISSWAQLSLGQGEVVDFIVPRELTD